MGDSAINYGNDTDTDKLSLQASQLPLEVINATLQDDNLTYIPDVDRFIEEKRN